jgi:hypothetical protein
MPELKTQVLVGNKGYKVALNLDSLNHLCIARELSNIKLIKMVKDERFDTWKDERFPEYTELDYRVFKHLLAKLIRGEVDNSRITSLLYTMSTGEVTRWHYTREQNFVMAPFIDILPVHSSMVLHKTQRTNAYSLDQREDSGDNYNGYEEVTLYNINWQKLKDHLPEQDVLDALTPPPPQQQQHPIAATEAAIKEFLRSL